MYPLLETIRTTIFNYKIKLSNVELELENLAFVVVDQSKSNGLDCSPLANAGFTNPGKGKSKSR